MFTDNADNVLVCAIARVLSAHYYIYTSFWISPFSVTASLSISLSPPFVTHSPTLSFSLVSTCHSDTLFFKCSRGAPSRVGTNIRCGLTSTGR